MISYTLITKTDIESTSFIRPTIIRRFLFASSSESEIKIFALLLALLLVFEIMKFKLRSIKGKSQRTNPIDGDFEKQYLFSNSSHLRTYIFKLF